MSKVQRHGGGHMGGMRAGEKAKDFKGTMKKIVKYMSAYKLGIFAVMLFGVGIVMYIIRLRHLSFRKKNWNEILIRMNRKGADRHE